ncbi:MAG: hypothetical protein V7776_12485 [Halopseudomonas aestusnigri]
MTLRGSWREEKLRGKLLAFREALFNNVEDRKMLMWLMKAYPDMYTAYLLHWIPEQGEDIYHYLINADKICIIEVSRVDPKLEPIIEDYPLEFYKKEFGKEDRIQFEIAQELVKSDFKKYVK